MVESMTRELMKRNTSLSIAMGVALMAAGVLAILAPLMTGVAVEIVVGALIIVAGVTQMVHAVVSSNTSARLLTFFLGLVAILAGILLLAHPLAGLGFLTLLLAAYFFVDGILEIAFSMRLRPMQGWVWTLIGGVVTMLLGAFIWMRWPLTGAWAVGTLVGVSILIIGISVLTVGLGVRREEMGAEAQAPAR